MGSVYNAWVFCTRMSSLSLAKFSKKEWSCMTSLMRSRGFTLDMFNSKRLFLE